MNQLVAEPLLCARFKDFGYVTIGSAVTGKSVRTTTRVSEKTLERASRGKADTGTMIMNEVFILSRQL